MRRINFRFGRHAPLLEEKPGLEIHEFDPNDLVEHELLYMACFPGKPGSGFDEEWLMTEPSQTESRLEALGKSDKLATVARWVDVSRFKLTLNADPFHQVAILQPPA